MKSLIVLLSFFSAQVYADQCAWNDRSIAARGAKLIKTLAGITGERASAYVLCEPCGETELERVILSEDNANSSGYDVTYSYAELRTPKGVEKEKTYWEVALNSRSKNPLRVDLAYVYVKTAKDVYANVATLVNCPVEGVTPVIYKGE